MKLRYLAHASFLITTDNGIRIITDPYQAGKGFNYLPVTETADIVTVSHEHGDHNHVETVSGSPAVVRDSTMIKGITITAVRTFHDESGGSQRGANTVFILDIDGMKVAHMGDLGHPLTKEQVKAIGDIDIMMVPVGGFFTIDAKTAADTAALLKAKVIIPMHFKTAKCELPISDIDGFIVGKTNVKRDGNSEVSLEKAGLPLSPEIIVLEPSH